MSRKFSIRKKESNHPNGFKTFSIRIDADVFAQLENLAEATNRSRNEIICGLILYALDRCEIDPSGITDNTKTVETENPDWYVPGEEPKEIIFTEDPPQELDFSQE